MLSAGNRLWYLHEPFNHNKGLCPRDLKYVGAARTDRCADRLMRDLLSGRETGPLQLPYANEPLGPLNLLRAPRGRRTFIKEAAGCLMLEYLVKRFDFETVVLFRHPLAAAMSYHRLGWPVAEYLDRFVQDEPLMETYLSSHRALIEKYCSEESLKATFVLYCCLYTVLWHIAERTGLHRVIYENLCRAPIDQFHSLFRRLNLKHDGDVKSRHAELCKAPSGQGSLGS